MLKPGASYSGSVPFSPIVFGFAISIDNGTISCNSVFPFNNVFDSVGYFKENSFQLNQKREIMSSLLNLK